MSDARSPNTNMIAHTKDSLTLQVPLHGEFHCLELRYSGHLNFNSRSPLRFKKRGRRFISRVTKPFLAVPHPPGAQRTCFTNRSTKRRNPKKMRRKAKSP